MPGQLPPALIEAAGKIGQPVISVVARGLTSAAERTYGTGVGRNIITNWNNLSAKAKELVTNDATKMVAKELGIELAVDEIASVVENFLAKNGTKLPSGIAETGAIKGPPELSSVSTFIPPVGFGGNGESGVNEYIRKRYSYSGHDMVCSIIMPMPDGSGTITKVIGELQHITYSIHEEKSLIRNLGNMNPRGYVFGPRTIAGTMVFSVFYRHFALELMKEYTDKKGMTTHFLMDELPEFDLVISCANEYGDKSVLVIYGITLVNEGQVMSINDVYTENTYEYYAKDIDYLTEVTDKATSSKKENKTEKPIIVDEKNDDNSTEDSGFFEFLKDSSEESDKEDNSEKPIEEESNSIMDYLSNTLNSISEELPSLNDFVAPIKQLTDKTDNLVNNILPEQFSLIDRANSNVQNKINEMTDKYENEKKFIENEIDTNIIDPDKGNQLLEELKKNYDEGKEALLYDYNNYKDNIIENNRQKLDSYCEQINKGIKEEYDKQIDKLLEEGEILQDKADKIRYDLYNSYNQKKEEYQTKFNEALDSLKI